MKHSEIINKWPTIREFSRDLGVKYAATHKWKTRESIPSWEWLTLIAAAQNRGIHVTLWDLAEGVDKRQKSEEKAAVYDTWAAGGMG